jgi:hypothetical protein
MLSVYLTLHHLSSCLLLIVLSYRLLLIVVIGGALHKYNHILINNWIQTYTATGLPSFQFGDVHSCCHPQYVPDFIDLFSLACYSLKILACSVFLKDTSWASCSFISLGFPTHSHMWQFLYTFGVSGCVRSRMTCTLWTTWIWRMHC